MKSYFVYNLVAKVSAPTPNKVDLNHSRPPPPSPTEIMQRAPLYAQPAQTGGPPDQAGLLRVPEATVLQQYGAPSRLVRARESAARPSIWR